ncbi:MAG: PLP-dependent transferase [Xanthomonadales bacterium]|nr:PLP-dependent transferase [Xanthomonadales bacterium]
MKFEKYATKFVQEIGSKQGAISPPITQSAAFAYGDSATGEGIFDGSVQKPLYSRMGNPTTAKLEGMLALHMGSTIYSDFSDEQREFLGITPGLIRVSIGLENPEDIIADFIRARN